MLPPVLSSLIAGALRCYGPDFQRVFGDDVIRLFTRQYEARAASKGRLGLAWFVVTTLVSLTLHGLLDRAGDRLSRKPSVSRPPRGTSMTSFFHDLRQGLRASFTSPAFAVVAAFTLGLGIAVNTTLFSLVNALLLSELPVSEPASFAFVWSTSERMGTSRSLLLLADAQALREEARSLEGVAVALEASSVLNDGTESPSRVLTMRVTQNLFDVWGIETVLGRAFVPGEDRPGGDEVAVLSHGFWDRRYGRDPEVLGRVVQLDGEPHTIVGVLSPRMEFGDISNVDFWVPLGLDLATDMPGVRTAFVSVRIAEGVSVESAQEEATLIASRREEQDPAHNEGWGLRISPVEEELLNEEDAAVMLVAALCGGFVLLIACTNVANMFLARATTRSREIAVRLAMGASRARLLRQLLTEGLLLALPAGGIGLFLTGAITRTLVLVSAEQQWIYRAMKLDGNVLAFALAVTLATPLVFALAPSLRAARLDVSSALREGGRSGTSRKALRARGLLVATQVAMALSLMIVTGLLVRAAVVLRTFDLGFETRGLLTAELRLSERDYPSGDDQLRFYDELGSRAASLPNVVGVALVNPAPLTLAPPARPFAIEGGSGDYRDRPSAQITVVSPGYFGLLGIDLVRGRDVDERDDATSARVALLNERAAEKFFADKDPLGRRIRTTDGGGVEGGGNEPGEWLEIVGIVGDTFDTEVASVTGAREWAAPTVFLPIAQSPTPRVTLLVRSAPSSPPEALLGELRSRVAELDDGPILVGTGTLDEVRDLLYASANAIMSLFLVFAVFALFMASMGIYSVMSYAVTEREHEIGLRMALGANRESISRMVLGQSGRFVLAGSVAGLALAFVFGRLIAATLIGVSPHDPFTFVSVLAVLLVVALVANYIPTRRATRVDPLSALRAD